MFRDDFILFVMFLNLMFNIFTCIIYVHHLLAWCSQRSEEDIQSLKTTVTDVCKSLCGPLQEEQVLLTNELSLYLPELYFFPTELFFLQYIVIMVSPP